jgi:chlorite dismutase
MASDKDGKTYVALMFFTMKDSWFELPTEERQSLTKEHVATLTRFTDRVALTHLAGTGLSKFDLVEVLEGDDLATIDEMISQFKAGAKARHGELHDIMILEKGLGQLV